MCSASKWHDKAISINILEKELYKSEQLVLNIISRTISHYAPCFIGNDTRKDVG